MMSARPGDRWVVPGAHPTPLPEREREPMSDIEIVAEPDPPELDTVFELFTGGLAFDIGANVGQSARSLSPRFVTVVSLEPAVESFALLDEVSAELGNVVALNQAVAASPGTIRLTVQHNHIARGQLTAYTDAVEDGHAWGTVEGHRDVEATTVDALAATWGAPDFLKCDVEGSEVEVFRGAAETLQGRPSLYIEVHNADLGEQLREILDPIYLSALRQIRHPNYPPGSWGYDNHFWLVAVTA